MIKLIGDFQSVDYDEAAGMLDMYGFLDAVKMQSPVLREWRASQRRKFAAAVRESGRELGISIYEADDIDIASDMSADYIKIPSCRCCDFALQNEVRERLPDLKILHISTGMTTAKDRGALRAKSLSMFEYVTSYNPDRVYLERGFPGFSCHRPEAIFGQAAILSGARFIEYKLSDETHSQLAGLRSWIDDNQDKLAMMIPRPQSELTAPELSARQKTWRAS